MHINVNYINNGDINKLVKVFTEVTGAVLIDSYNQMAFCKKGVAKSGFTFQTSFITV